MLFACQQSLAPPRLAPPILNGALCNARSACLLIIVSCDLIWLHVATRDLDGYTFTLPAIWSAIVVGHGVPFPPTAAVLATIPSTKCHEVLKIQSNNLDQTPSTFGIYHITNFDSKHWNHGECKGPDPSKGNAGPSTSQFNISYVIK